MFSIRKISQVTRQLILVVLNLSIYFSFLFVNSLMETLRKQPANKQSEPRWTFCLSTVIAQPALNGFVPQQHLEEKLIGSSCEWDSKQLLGSRKPILASHLPQLARLYLLLEGVDRRGVMSRMKDDAEKLRPTPSAAYCVTYVHFSVNHEAQIHPKCYPISEL